MFITKSLFVQFIDHPKLAWFKVNNKQYFDWINNFDDEDFKNYLINLGKTAEKLVIQYFENKYKTKICNISPFLKIEDEDYDKECFVVNSPELIEKVNKNTLYQYYYK